MEILSLPFLDNFLGKLEVIWSFERVRLASKSDGYSFSFLFMFILFVRMALFSKWDFKDFVFWIYDLLPKKLMIDLLLWGLSYFLCEILDSLFPIKLRSDFVSFDFGLRYLIASYLSFF